MGRSSAEQALQNRAKIVEIASNLFRAKGVEAVSVADIMAAAGMTVGGFYKHFSSKDALVQEATAFAFGAALAHWQGFFAGAAASKAAMRAELVTHYLRPDPQIRCPIIAFAPHNADKDPATPGKQTYDQGTGALLDLFGAEKLPKDGPHDVLDADPDSLVLFAAMIGARILAEAAGSSDWTEAIKNAVIAKAEGA